MKHIILDISSVIGTNNTTGIQRVAIELSRRFINRYEECSLIAYDLIKKSYYYVDKQSFNLNCYNPQRTKNVKITSQQFNFDKVNSSYSLLDIDSIHDTHCRQRSFFYKFLKQRGVEIISLVHDLLPISNPEYWPVGFYDKYFLLYIAAVFQYSDKIITTTQYTKTLLIKYLSLCNATKKIFVMPLGSDLKENYDINKVSKEIIDCSNANFLLMVATFEPRKNQIVLLNAFEQIAKKTNLSLIFAGRLGWSYEEIIRKIKSDHYFKKRMFIINNASNDDIIYLYKKAFAFVFPSLNEGYGLPIVEAMYYKCPILVSDIPVFREIAGNNALYFDNRSGDSLSQKVFELYNNKSRYNHFINRLKEFKINSWDNSFKRLIEIINYKF